MCCEICCFETSADSGHSIHTEDQSILEKFDKSSRPNVSKKEFKAVRSSRLNKDIKIHQVDEGSCTVVLDESEYKDKLNTLLETRVYEPLPKDLTAMVERKVQKLLSKHSTSLPPEKIYSLP
jgi:hypothetical protein